MNFNEQAGLVPVRICRNRRHAEQYALVLAAMGVSSKMAFEGDTPTLYVAREDFSQAKEELAAYDRENAAHPPAARRLRSALPPAEVALVYWAVLLFFYAAARRDAFSFDWVGEGAVQAGLMLKGEWWRAVTALFLHVDVAHLLGNLVFGTFFLLLLAQVTGAGIAGLTMVAAGTAGNVLNAAVQSPGHTSIGASTAVFAGLGALAALQQVWRPPDRKFLSLRNWVPLAGGVTLLLFLGFSGENTDILGHVLGFGSGVAAGWLLSKRDQVWDTDRVLQWKCAAAAGGIVVVAWAAAAAS